LPWKSERAKKCVTTYLPNRLALKMDDATRERNQNLDQSERVQETHRLFHVERREDCADSIDESKYVEEPNVNLFGIIFSADLSFSSKYTCESDFSSNHVD